MAGLGMPELLVIGGLAVLLFGGSKLPQLGGAIGESIRNFKRGVKDANDETAVAKKEPSKEKES